MTHTSTFVTNWSVQGIREEVLNELISTLNDSIEEVPSVQLIQESVKLEVETCVQESNVGATTRRSSRTVSLATSISSGPCTISRTASMDIFVHTPKSNKRRREWPLRGLVEITNQVYLSELGLDNLDAPPAPKKANNSKVRPYIVGKDRALWRRSSAGYQTLSPSPPGQPVPAVGPSTGLPTPSPSPPGQPVAATDHATVDSSDEGSVDDSEENYSNAESEDPSNNDNVNAVGPNNNFGLESRRASNGDEIQVDEDQYLAPNLAPGNSGTHIVNVRRRDDNFHVGNDNILTGPHVKTLQSQVGLINDNP